MGWKAQDQTFEISARIASMGEVDGDRDATVPQDAGIYVLRDFVQTGDALRIKLPFTDPNTEYPEFLWVENHQGYGVNGDRFDRFQFGGDPCIEDIVPGLDMYLQIDKEIRQSTSYVEVYGGPGDYLRPLDANGHFDDLFDKPAKLDSCICWMCPKIPFSHGMPNPLTGTGDRQITPADLDQSGTLTHDDGRSHAIESVGLNYNYHAYQLGNARQVFTLGGNSKLGIATNPSSASMMNLVGFDIDRSTVTQNLRRIYLNGVSVEILAQYPDGSIQVRVRFDDVDVSNDARWCADEIQLNPVATSTGYSLNITANHTLTLDQGTTATRRTDPITYNGKQVFASPTLMRCPTGTWLNLAANSTMVVDNGSTLRVEDGGRVDIASGAVLRVKRGGRLELMGNSTLNVAAGGKVIIEEDVVNGNDGRLVYYPNARINLEASTAEVEFAGTLEIKDNATFTTGRLADPAVTHGVVRFSNTDASSQNIIAGANSRFILRSDNINRKMLEVDQESLYGPSQLVEFTLKDGSALMADHARIVPPVVNGCVINFINARVTSTSGPRNTHRGVRLNGQGFLTLSGSTFSNGATGLYCYNSTLHSRPLLTNCSFLNCGTGMYNYDTGILATGCAFNGCDEGLICEQMSQSSVLSGCSAIGNADVCV